MKKIKKSIIIIIIFAIGSSYLFSNTVAFAKQEDKHFKAEGLLIPEKLQLTIDPLEINGKGQVYSERYVIKNSGSIAGKLSLTDFTCSPREESGIKVRTDKAGLHNSKEKSIYVEMEFDNGETVVLSRPDEVYEAVLAPGEELSFTFSGEVNENSFQKWADSDIAVSMLYSWNAWNIEDDSEDVREAEMLEYEELEETESEKPKNSPFSIKGEFIENGEEQEDIKPIQIPEKFEIIVEPLENNGKGALYSEQYSIQNIGNIAGRLILSDFTCQVEEGCEFFIEALFENGDKVVLSQPDTTYEVELKPGEELKFVFSGEIDEKARQEWESDEAVITVKYTFEENDLHE